MVNCLYHKPYLIGINHKRYFIVLSLDHKTHALIFLDFHDVNPLPPLPAAAPCASAAAPPRAAPRRPRPLAAGRGDRPGVAVVGRPRGVVEDLFGNDGRRTRLATGIHVGYSISNNYMGCSWDF